MALFCDYFKELNGYKNIYRTSGIKNPVPGTRRTTNGKPIFLVL